MVYSPMPFYPAICVLLLQQYFIILTVLFDYLSQVLTEMEFNNFPCISKFQIFLRNKFCKNYLNDDWQK